MTLSLRRWFLPALVVAAATGAGVATDCWWAGWPVRAVLRDEGEAWPLAFSPDGRTLVTFTGGGASLTPWDARAADKGMRWGGQAGQKVFDGAFTPDGRTFVAFSYDPTLRPSPLFIGLIDAHSGRTRALIPTKITGWYGHAISADGQRLRMVGLMMPGNVIVGAVDVDLAAGQLLSTRPLSAPRTSGADSVSPDGRFLAAPAAPAGKPSNGPRPDVVLWDLDADLEAARLSGPPGAPGVTSLAFSADGTTLALGREGGHVELWDLATRRHRATFSPHRPGYDSRTMTFSPDGTTLVSMGLFQRQGLTLETARLRFALLTGDRTWEPPFEAAFLDPSTGKVRHCLTSEGRPTFSPDGRTLATGHIDGSPRLRDLPARPKPPATPAPSSR